MSHHEQSLRWNEHYYNIFGSPSSYKLIQSKMMKLWYLCFVALSCWNNYTVVAFLRQQPSRCHSHSILGILQHRNNNAIKGIYSRNDNDESNNFLMDQWSKADFLEIRLDSTLAACHALGRFFIYDLTLPKKSIPRFELEDIIMLADLFSSVIVLAFLWTMVGVFVTGIFQDTARSGDSSFDPIRMVVTSCLVGPLWILVEIMFHWPPAGMTVTTNESIMAAIVIGTIGLCSTMSVGRIFSSNFLF